MSGKEIHNYGTDDGWHGVIKKGGEFPPEKDRYHLYIGKQQYHHESVLVKHS
jgi:putative glutathione S-transferase